MQSETDGYLTFGFALLCCTAVICFFPNYILPDNTPVPLYRQFNLLLGIFSSVLAPVYAMAIRKSNQVVMSRVFVGTALGHTILITGIMFVVLLGQQGNKIFAPLAGAFCGAGLAITIILWFYLLTILTKQRTVVIQGRQALLGGILFIALIPISPALHQICCFIFISVSFFLSCLLIRNCIHSKSSCFLAKIDSDAKTHKSLSASATEVLLLPGVGFVMISLLYGVLTAVAMGPEGSSYGSFTRSCGGVIGAVIFLSWAHLSSNHNYGTFLQINLAVVSIALIFAPLDALMFFLGGAYQMCGLLYYSHIIEELIHRRNFSVLFISIGYSLVHIFFLLGLYVPARFGVDSYQTFHHSTSLIVFMMYVVFGVLLFILQRSKKIELEQTKHELDKQTEKHKMLKRVIAESSSEGIDPMSKYIALHYGLTKRETEVFSFLARGRTITHICNTLFLARDTVKGHTKKIYMKLDVHSKQEIIDMVESMQEKVNENPSLLKSDKIF